MPGACLPEHIQGLIEGAPLAAGAEQLGGEHQPLAPLALGEGPRIGRRGGGRRMVDYLAREGIPISRDRVRNLMRRIGLRAIY